MKEATIYKTFAALLAIIAGAALVAVFLGHNYHLFTLAAAGSVAYILDGVATKLEEEQR